MEADRTSPANGVRGVERTDDRVLRRGSITALCDLTCGYTFDAAILQLPPRAPELNGQRYLGIHAAGTGYRTEFSNPIGRFDACPNPLVNTVQQRTWIKRSEILIARPARAVEIAVVVNNQSPTL